MTTQFIRVCVVLVLLILLLGHAEGVCGQGGTERVETKADTSDAATVVLRPARMRRAATTSAADVLRAVPGADVTQMGLARRAVALRGPRSIFSGGPLVLVDDRPAALPALGANIFPLMPIQRVDLKRVEVERAPAVARYGPAAHDGVIRFITKNPFDDPGTTVAASGGPHPYGSGQFRHAADVGGTFGYEVTAYAARGIDEVLDAADPADRRWLAHDRVYDDPGQRQDHQRIDAQTGRLQRDGDVQKLGIHGRLAYRLAEGTAIAAQGGYASLTARALSEVGPLQVDYLGYAFGQLELRTDRAFAQFVLNNNDTSTSYLYGAGQPVVERSVEYVAQARYRLGRLLGRADVTAGAAAHWTRPRTEGTLMGRHEERDAIDAYGAYVRARTMLAPRLDLALALRGDVDDFDGRVWLAPHATLTYAMAPTHTLHLRYDRAAAAPQASERFLDAEVRRQTLGAPFELVSRARGADDGFTFHTFRSRGEAAALLPDVDGFGQPVPVGRIPLHLLYEAAAERFDALLADATSPSGPAQTLSATQTQQLAASLRALAGGISEGAVTRGELGLPRGAGGYTPVASPSDVSPLARPVTQALEVGYRGTLGRRMQLAATAYYVRTKNALGPLQAASPLVYVPALAQDVDAALAPAITKAAADPDAPLSALLEAMDVTPDEAARLAADLVERAFDGVPVAAVQPDRAVLPAGTSTTEVEALLTYRNVDRVEYAGVEAGVRARLRSGVTAFGAAALASDLRVRAPAGGDATTRPALVRNAPAFRARLGLDVALDAAWTLHATGHYATRFPVRAGLYEGTVAAAHPIDAGLRYDARRHVPGLQLELTVQNVFNQKRRTFVGGADRGRRALARLTYAL